jgi:hypothetical protein
MAENWVQWEGVHVGGPMASTVLTVHKACGSFVADRETHARVCTAPPWAPPPADRSIRDFYPDGTIETRTP